MKIGFQAGGKITNLKALCERNPISIKLYGEALNLGVAQFIADHCGAQLVVRNIGRGLDYGWNANYKQTAVDVANAHIAILSPFLGFNPWVELHNEPPGYDSTRTPAQNIDEAKRGNEWTVIVAERMAAAGFHKKLAYSFSVGTPPMYKYGDRVDMWPYYQDGIAACDGLALHEYWLPSMLHGALQPGLTLRYRDAYAAMRTKRPIMLTEAGKGFVAGYQAYGNMQGYTQELDQYNAELEKDSYLLCAHLFLCGSDSGQWASWDVGQDAEYEQFFIPWLQSGQIPAVITLPQTPPANPPPVNNPPIGGTVEPTSLERVNAAWNSIGRGLNDKGIAYNVDAALYRAAFALDPETHPIGNEYPLGADYVGQAYSRFFVDVRKGDWANVKARSYKDGSLWVAAAPPVTGPPPIVPPIVPSTPSALPYKFPQALIEIGAVGSEGVRVEGQPFFRLAGAAVRRGISAFMVVTLLGQNGMPLIGRKVVNLFPDGNGEVQQTDGSGNVRFQFGASSAFTNPGGGPFTVFVADETAAKDEDAIPKRVSWLTTLSDAVSSLGDFQGTHTEINMQFIEQN